MSDEKVFEFLHRGYLNGLKLGESFTVSDSWDYTDVCNVASKYGCKVNKSSRFMIEDEEEISFLILYKVSRDPLRKLPSR